MASGRRLGTEASASGGRPRGRRTATRGAQKFRNRRSAETEAPRINLSAAARRHGALGSALAAAASAWADVARTNATAGAARRVLEAPDEESVPDTIPPHRLQHGVLQRASRRGHVDVRLLLADRAAAIRPKSDHHGCGLRSEQLCREAFQPNWLCRRLERQPRVPRPLGQRKMERGHVPEPLPAAVSYTHLTLPTT